MPAPLLNQVFPAKRIGLVVTCRVALITGICLGLSPLRNPSWGQERLQSDTNQSLRLSDLTESEFAAIEQIGLPSVTGTISFLASDELAGRGTPSKELDIAAAYVASRLRAIGAEGFGPNGSLFIRSKINVVRTPATSQVMVNGAAVPASLIESGNEAIEIAGRIQRDTIEQPLTGSIGAPVLIQAESLRDQAGELSGLRRAVRRLLGLGATAVIVEADIASPLWESALKLQTDSRTDSIRMRYGLPVVLVQTGQIDVTADKTPELTMQLPPMIREEAEVRNVAGVLRGSDPQLADEVMIFSAHLDHLGDGAIGPDTIYNGADDDASGVTAVLTLADAFGALEKRTERSLMFVTFWGEERGLLGSKEFVANSPWPLEKVVANINIEMIGRPEPGAEQKMWMTGWDKSTLGPIVAQGSRRVGVETFEHPSYSARLYAASDNYSFVQAGVIAHSFSAGSLHSDYHQVSDEWQSLNLPHMTQIIRGLFAGTLPIAKALATPSKP